MNSSILLTLQFVPADQMPGGQNEIQADDSDDE